MAADETHYEFLERKGKMNRDRYRLLRELLLHKRNLLLRDIEIIERETYEQTDHSGFDTAEEGVFNSEKEIEFSMLERDRRQLEQIDQAIERFKRGRYGNCRACSKEIPLKRLRVIPFAEFCVRCQQRDEREIPEQSPEYSGNWVRLHSYSRDPVNGEAVA